MRHNNSKFTSDTTVRENMSNKKSKCSNDPHKPYRTSSVTSLTQNHHQHLSRYMKLFKRMTALSLNPVTLSEHQGRSNLNQTEEFHRVYHHTQLEINQFTSVPTQGNVKCVFYKIISAELFSSNIT